MNTVEEIVEYYVLAQKLKNVIRNGWKQWNVQQERLESVAEHVYGTMNLAVAIWSQTLPAVNLSEVLLTLALHETEEILIGDITPFDQEVKTKKERGREAVLKIFNNFKAKEVFVSLLENFEEKSTAEAIFAYKCDKLECDLQAKIYDEQNSLFLEKATDKIKQNKNLLLLKEKGCKGADFFLHYDRAQLKKYADDNDVFMEISKYIEKNRITKPLSAQTTKSNKTDVKK